MVPGFDNTFADPSSRFARLPNTATSLFSTLEGDANGGLVTQKDVFSLAGSPDLFHLQTDFATAPPVGESFFNLANVSAIATKPRTDSSLGGTSSLFNFGGAYSGSDLRSPANPASAATTLSASPAGAPGASVSAPTSSKNMLLAVGGLALLGIGLYVWLR
jgi:hypothetical protein